MITSFLRRAYRIPDQFQLAICHSFYNSTQLIPSPRGDFFAAGVAAQYVGDNDIAIMFTQPPGVLNLKRSALPAFQKASVIEIPPPSDVGVLGYPNGCLLTNLLNFIDSPAGQSARELLHSSQILCPFPPSDILRTGRDRGLRFPQHFDPFLVNSKGEFLDAVRREGMVTCNYKRYITLAQLLDPEHLPTNSSSDWWLKGSGAGGDLVVKIGAATPANMKRGWEHLRKRIEAAFAHADFSVREKAKLVDIETFFPLDGLILEEDVSVFGRHILNATSVMWCDDSGSGGCLGLYSQDLAKDPLKGAFKLNFDPLVLSYLDRYNLEYGEFSQLLTRVLSRLHPIMARRGYRGLYGADFFVVLDERNPVVVLTEVNARLTTQGGGCVSLELATDFPHQMPFTAVFPSPVNSIAELSEYCDIGGGRNLLTDPSADVRIFPQTFGSIWEQVDGDYVLRRGSNVVRLMILGQAPSSISSAVEILFARGVKPQFESPSII